MLPIGVYMRLTTVSIWLTVVMCVHDCALVSCDEC